MSICAVVVSHQPAAEIIGNVTALLLQVNEVVIVDNGSGGPSRDHLRLLSDRPNVSVIYNDENLGIGSALNIGVRFVRERGHQWVATFDQDSRLTAGLVATMVEAYEAYGNKEKVALLCPRYRDKSTGKITGHSAKSAQSRAFTEVLVAMTSGNLIRPNIFDTAGYFNEALFIDYVDYEFCLRCVEHGYKILEVTDAILEHCVGSPTQHSVLGKIVVATNHSATRRYYGFRNRIFMYRKYAFAHPFLLNKMVYGSFMELVKVLFLEEQRWRKLAAAVRGTYHGVLGRLGRI